MEDYGLDLGYAAGARQALEHLGRVLKVGETPLCGATGFLEGRPGLVVATTQRFLFIYKSETPINDPYDKITSFRAKAGVITALLEIVDKDGRATIKQIHPRTRLIDFAAVLQKGPAAYAGSHVPAGPAPGAKRGEDGGEEWRPKLRPKISPLPPRGATAGSSAPPKPVTTGQPKPGATTPPKPAATALPKPAATGQPKPAASTPQSVAQPPPPAAAVPKPAVPAAPSAAPPGPGSAPAPPSPTPPSPTPTSPTPSAAARTKPPATTSAPAGGPAKPSLPRTLMAPPVAQKPTAGWRPHLEPAPAGSAVPNVSALRPTEPSRQSKPVSVSGLLRPGEWVVGTFTDVKTVGAGAAGAERPAAMAITNRRLLALDESGRLVGEWPLSRLVPQDTGPARVTVSAGLEFEFMSQSEAVEFSKAVVTASFIVAPPER